MPYYIIIHLELQSIRWYLYVSDDPTWLIYTEKITTVVERSKLYDYALFDKNDNNAKKTNQRNLFKVYKKYHHS